MHLFCFEILLNALTLVVRLCLTPTVSEYQYLIAVVFGLSLILDILFYCHSPSQ